LQTVKTYITTLDQRLIVANQSSLNAHVRDVHAHGNANYQTLGKSEPGLNATLSLDDDNEAMYEMGSGGREFLRWRINTYCHPAIILHAFARKKEVCLLNH